MSSQGYLVVKDSFSVMVGGLTAGVGVVLTGGAFATGAAPVGVLGVGMIVAGNAKLIQGITGLTSDFTVASDTNKENHDALPMLSMEGISGAITWSLLGGDPIQGAKTAEFAFSFYNPKVPPSPPGFERLFELQERFERIDKYWSRTEYVIETPGVLPAPAHAQPATQRPGSSADRARPSDLGRSHEPLKRDSTNADKVRESDGLPKKCYISGGFRIREIPCAPDSPSNSQPESPRPPQSPSKPDEQKQSPQDSDQGPIHLKLGGGGEGPYPHGVDDPGNRGGTAYA